nr:protein-methionine-sulfoxide reductase heme-binding subunit MsrQ [Fluviibacterium sp. MJW13]
MTQRITPGANAPMTPLWAAVTDALNTASRRLPTWPVYLFGLLPMPWFFWKALNGEMGVNPIEALEHRYGLLALQFLVAGLAVTPLRRMLGVNLIRFRRAIGLTAFFYVLAHLSVWALLDVQSLAAIWKDIVKRPYITIGMAGFLCLLPLALTSNNWSLRRLGPLRWRRLHMLTYPAVLLGSAHFVMLVKGWQTEPILYFGAIVGLLMLRLVPRR